MSLIDDITTLVQNTIAEQSGQELSLTPDAELINEGYLDSLTLLQLFSSLQNDYDIELDPADLTEENFGSIGAIAKLVETQLDA